MKKWNWKQTLAALCAAACAIGTGGLQGLSAAADLELPTVQVLALGDDCLAAGSDGTSAAAIAADYLGGTVTNHAELRQTSADLVEQLKTDTAVQTDVQNADVIFVSTGVNDLLNAVYFENPYVVDTAASYSTMSGLLKNLPSENASLMIMQVITALPGCVSTLNANLEEAVSLIRAQNSDADIVIQNVINPMAVDIDALNLTNKRAVAATELFYFLDTCLNGGTYTSSNVSSAAINIPTGVNTTIHNLDSRANVSVADYYAAFVGENKQVSMGFVLTDLANLQVTYTSVGQVFLASALLESSELLSNGDGSVITAAYDATGQRSALQTERASMDATIQAAEANTRTAYSLGDIDNDNNIGTQDAYLTLLQYSENTAGGDSTLNPAQRIAADADNDGSITTQDAFLWLQYYSLMAAGSDISLETYLRENGRA